MEKLFQTEKLRLIYRFWKPISFVSIIVFALVYLHLAPEFVSGQSYGDEWSLPINISQSGGASNPSLIIDSDGMFHAIWQDVFSEFVYTTGDGTSWNPPEKVLFPFPNEEERPPKFIADFDGGLHAFWIDIDGQLFHSLVPVTQITNLSQWSAPRLLGVSVFSLEVEIDDGGGIHLTYIAGESLEGQPAGIYYTHLFANSSGWSPTATIFESPYLRTITLEDSNIDIETATQNNITYVYIAWDNRPREKLFIVKSDTRGNSWDDPYEIVGSSTTHGLDIPYGVQIQADKNQVLALWNLGDPGYDCSLQFRWSSDNGDSWSDSLPILDQQVGCPHENSLLVHEEGNFILYSVINNQSYLMAWDGKSWSDYQPQRELSNLVDSETHSIIEINCQDLALLGDQLFIIGCDSTVSSDIWLTSRMVGDLDTWFPDPSRWSNPESIARGVFVNGSSHLVTDSTGNIHAFWNEVANNGLNPNIAIFYALWDGENWSQPVELLKKPSGKVNLLDVAITLEGVIYVLWDDGELEGLFLSWIYIDENVLELVTSDPLPTFKKYAFSPSIILDSEENIIISYAIPLNEGRGIYLISSSDGGRTWTDPVLVVDAYAMGWEMVDHPKMALAANNDLHVIWTTYALLPDPTPTALFSAISIDGGNSWSNAELVSEGRVTWSDIVESGESTLHRFWEDNARGTQRILHQVSKDNGLSWDEPDNISAVNENEIAISIFKDKYRQAHIFQLTLDYSDNNHIHHWTWDGNQWQANDRLDFGSFLTAQPESLSATITLNDMLGIFFTSTFLEEAGEVRYQINFVKRQLDFLQIPTLIPPTPTPQPDLETTEIPTDIPTQIPTQVQETIQVITPTVTISFPTEQETNQSRNPQMGLIIGGVITSVLILASMVNYLRRRQL